MTAKFGSSQRLEDEDAIFMLPEDQLDLWEHAALLYHNYEWQDAAHGFSRLSEDVKDPLLRSFCLLNTVMILARLGDYEMANVYVKIAAQQDVTSAMTAFLAGIVTYELGNASFAEHCFRVCWHSFHSRAAIDFSNVGLDFVLDPQLALHNFYQTKTHEQPASMHTIPADIIFEAPKRTIERSRPPRNRRRPPPLQDIMNVSKEERESASPSTVEAAGDCSPLSRSIASCLPEPLQIRARQSPLNTEHNKDNFTASDSTGRRSFALEHDSFRKRPKTPYVPRDAGPVLSETMSLAKFIRNAGRNSSDEADYHRQNRKPKYARQKPKLIPRDAHAEYHSMAELSAFMHSKAPGEENRPIHGPQDAGANAHNGVGPVLAYGSLDKQDARSKKSRTSSNPKSPIWQRIGAHLPSFRKDSATACGPTSPEILQPSRYQPTSNKEERVPRNGQQPLSPAINISPSPVNQRRLPTDMSDLERYRKQQRHHTLDTLEGNDQAEMAHSRLFPPWRLATQSGADASRARQYNEYGPPSPVNTERFFETVLDKWRRF